MDDRLAEMLDQQRWLMNNGLFTDAAQNNLYVYGFLVNKDIVGVEVDIKPETKGVHYILYVKPRLISTLAKYETLKSKTSLWSLLRLRFLLKRHGNLNLKTNLSSFVKDYCGPGWNVTMDIRKESEYHDSGEGTRD